MKRDPKSITFEYFSKNQLERPVFDLARVGDLRNVLWQCTIKSIDPFYESLLGIQSDKYCSKKECEQELCEYILEEIKRKPYNIKTADKFIMQKKMTSTGAAAAASVTVIPTNAYEDMEDGDIDGPRYSKQASAPVNVYELAYREPNQAVIAKYNAKAAAETVAQDFDNGHLIEIVIWMDLDCSMEEFQKLLAEYNNLSSEFNIVIHGFCAKFVQKKVIYKKILDAKINKPSTEVMPVLMTSKTDRKDAADYLLTFDFVDFLAYEYSDDTNYFIITKDAAIYNLEECAKNRYPDIKLTITPEINFKMFRRLL